MSLATPWSQVAVEDILEHGTRNLFDEISHISMLIEGELQVASMPDRKWQPQIATRSPSRNGTLAKYRWSREHGYRTGITTRG